ncbi:MAG: hypothetical protein AAGA54_24090 [Myxococcota bacterium]
MPALLDNVLAEASQLEQDGARFRLVVPTDPGYPGVILEGLDRHEASTELAESFGFQNGDIVRAVDGTVIDDHEVLMDVLEKLAAAREATLLYMGGTQTRQVRIEPR